MPIYEYDCPSCGHFEFIHKAGDKPLRNCPTCQEKGKKTAVTKNVSLSAFQLKGGGWYKDGYSSVGSKGSDAAGGISPKAETKAATPKAASGGGSDTSGSNSGVGSKTETSSGGGGTSSASSPAHGCGTSCGCK